MKTGRRGKCKYKIAIPSQFQLKTLYDFLELIFCKDCRSEQCKLFLDFEIEVAHEILRRLKDKEVVCDSDFLDIIMTALYNLGYISDSAWEEYQNILQHAEQNNYSKTYVNKKVKDLIEEEFASYSTVLYHYYVAVNALYDLNLINFKTDSKLHCKRFTLARPVTFREGLMRLADFYELWYLDELDLVRFNLN